MGIIYIISLLCLMAAIVVQTFSLKETINVVILLRNQRMEDAKKMLKLLEKIEKIEEDLAMLTHPDVAQWIKEFLQS